MRCSHCGWETTGNETFCINCAAPLKTIPKVYPRSYVSDDSEPYGLTIDDELDELRGINRQLVESNRQTTQALNLVGQMVANGALLNFLKKR